jgi:hypothetical protein
LEYQNSARQKVNSGYLDRIDRPTFVHLASGGDGEHRTFYILRQHDAVFDRNTGVLGRFPEVEGASSGRYRQNDICAINCGHGLEERRL